MRKAIYWVTALIVLSVGITICVYFGIQPKSIPKIKLSYLKTSREFGDAMVLSSQPAIDKTKLILLGVLPEMSSHKELIPEMVDSLRRKYPNLVVIVDFRFGLKESLHADAEINPDVGNSDIATLIEAPLRLDKRILLILSVVHTSSLIKRNLINGLREQFAGQVMGLTIGNFPRSREEESDSLIRCQTEEADPTGYGSLGCMVLAMSRRNYYKRSKEVTMNSGYVGMMDQVGLFDFLALFRALK